MSGPLLLGLHRLGIKARRVGTTATSNVDNLQCLIQVFQSLRHLFQTGSVTTLITPVSNKKFFRNIQSTPWSTKSGLAGKDVANLRVAELTRKGLDDYSLRCLSNGEFQSIVFVKSISETVFVSNLLRHIRQERIDLDAVAAHMHGPAPPDKHKESARFYAASSARNCFNYQDESTPDCFVQLAVA